MYSRCKKCGFFDIDYIWDDESDEEISIFQCQKGNAVGLKLKGFLCHYFKECTYSPYIEKNTKCDKCEELSKCIENGMCIDITCHEDSQRHYTIGFGVVCAKFWDGRIVIVTKHAKQRMKQRCDIKSKSTDRMAAVAYEKGLKHSDLTGNLKKWVYTYIG